MRNDAYSQNDHNAMRVREAHSFAHAEIADHQTCGHGRDDAGQNEVTAPKGRSRTPQSWLA